MPTSRIIVFGGGTFIDGNDRVCLHQSSIDRAERIIDYYKVNEELFRNRTLINQPFILCTGGYGRLSVEAKENNLSDREAVLMADYLVTKGGLSKDLILLELESISTLTNWTKSIGLYQDKLDAHLFTPSDRLGLVSHPHHLKRIVYLAEKLGYKSDTLELIPTVQIDNQDYENQVLAAYKTYLKNTTDSREMEKRELDLYEDKVLMSHLRSMN